MGSIIMKPFFIRAVTINRFLKTQGTSSKTEQNFIITMVHETRSSLFTYFPNISPLLQALELNLSEVTLTSFN
jgi:hypothetical protein